MMTLGDSRQVGPAGPEDPAGAQGQAQVASGTGDSSGLKGPGWTPDPDGPSVNPPSSSIGATEAPAEGVTGEVRDFRERTEHFLGSLPLIVWTFRVEQYDEDGNPRTSVPVIMQGRAFTGYVGNGNQVEIRQTRQRGRDVRVRRLYNRTTDSWVVTRGFGPLIAASVVLLVVFLALFALLGIWAYRVFHAAAAPFDVGSAQTATASADVPGSEPPSPSAENEGSPPAADDGSSSGGLEPIEATEVESAPEPVESEVPALVTVSCTPTGGTAADTEIAVGQTVVWVNEGSEPMELDLSGSGIADPVGELFQPGDSHEITFRAAGSFGYTCVFPSDKQNGEVVVTQ